jgi:predicted alpha/beta hydrolase
MPEELIARAADGCPIGGLVWRHLAPGLRPVVVSNPATSVRGGYYARFAAFFSHGLDVITYDYRGLGASRPRSLRRFEASWVDWGRLDVEALLQYAHGTFAGQPMNVVARSIGGFVIGFAPSNHLMRRIVTVGAQHAYWRDDAPKARFQMLVKWHLFMPALTALVGYFPGRKLGWLEDTPGAWCATGAGQGRGSRTGSVAARGRVRTPRR